MQEVISLQMHAYYVACCAVVCGRETACKSFHWCSLKQVAVCMQIYPYVYIHIYIYIYTYIECFVSFLWNWIWPKMIWLRFGLYSLNTLCIKSCLFNGEPFVYTMITIYLISSTFSVCNDFMNKFQAIRAIYLSLSYMDDLLHFTLVEFLTCTDRATSLYPSAK